MAKGAAAILEIGAKLREKYPEATYALDWKNPFELLVGTILAAQSTDKKVNQILPGLFAKFCDAAGFARAKGDELEEEIRPTGFQKNKAKAIQGAADAIVRRFGGKVPKTMDEMLTLPGVQRKSANVVLNTAYGVASGIIVDVHVARVAPRLGLSREEKPEAVERDLMRIVPKKDWTHFGPALILHGRDTCTAKAPRCGECTLEEFCEKSGLDDAPSVASSRPMSASSTASNSAALPTLPGSWNAALGAEVAKPYFRELWSFVSEERATKQVFPPADEVFNALALTPLEKVKVVILGQDPYHDDGQAHGLCFSVRRGVKPPPSLVNMFKELETDLGIRRPDHGCLEAWAKQGVLLVNAVLTVRAHEPNSHKDRGWETFTDAVIKAVDARKDPVVFALWGAYAQKKAKVVDGTRHIVLKNAHPSPLSAKLFLGSKPFSAINAALEKAGKTPIDWRL